MNLILDKNNPIVYTVCIGEAPCFPLAISGDSQLTEKDRFMNRVLQFAAAGSHSPLVSPDDLRLIGEAAGMPLPEIADIAASRTAEEAAEGEREVQAGVEAQAEADRIYAAATAAAQEMITGGEAKQAKATRVFAALQRVFPGRHQRAQAETHAA